MSSTLNNGRPQIFGAPAHPQSVSVVGRLLVADRLRLQVMSGPRGIHTVANQLSEIDLRLVPPCLLVACPPRAQNLLHCLGEAVSIAQHQAIKLLLLRFRQVAPLQGLEMQPNRSYGSFQFMGDGVDEAVVLLTAPEFTHQENRIHHHPGNDQREEDDAEKQQHAFPPVEDDPSNVQGNSQRH